MPDNKDTPAPKVTTVSAILQDGTIVETIHQSADRQTAFATWPTLAGDAARVSGLRPPSPENNLLTHGVVLFPSAIGEPADQRHLLSAIRAFIRRYADLSEPFEEVASLYVLMTWVYDVFNEVPYLRLKGDYGSGKSRCLQTIGSICYKPMFVSGASTVSPMFRIIDLFRGTLILDESDFRFSDERAEIVKILNNGNAVGFPVLRSEATPTKEFNPRAFAVFGPKVIATRRDFEDQALESRCITEVMSGLPPRPDIPLTLSSSFHAEARDIRNTLLRFRFENLSRFRDTAATRPAGVEARVAQVFSPLVALALDDAMRDRIIEMARTRTGTIRAERSASVEAQLVEVMYDMRRQGVPFMVRDIASRFSERFGQDFERPVTARWVGGQLRRRLALTPVKRNGTFVVPETDYARLEDLFKRYGAHESSAETSGTLGMLKEGPETETSGS
jgi:hypothetical protein